MKLICILTVTLLMLVAIITGCSQSQAGDFSLPEAPGIRVTDEALAELAAGKGAYTLSYTERTS